VLSERRRTIDVPFENRRVSGTAITDLDLNLFRSTYLPAVIDPTVLLENNRSIDFQLASLGLAADTPSVPTALGLITIGYDPSAWLPGAYVQFVRFDGTNYGDAVRDEQELRSNVIELAKPLEDLIRVNITSRLTSNGLRDAKTPNYPFDALRELVMNAIIHRNYETSNSPIRINWFDDRVEITNPGGPFGQVNELNFRQVTDYRNPSLAATMKALGFVNRFGRGIRRAQTLLYDNDNPELEFTIDRYSWAVTVRSAK
jgi:ATP-dependent DNA helicase RecG